MTTDIERELLARAAVTELFGTDAGELSINLFVEHHISELPQGYWQERLGKDTPEPSEVISLLVLRSTWGEDDREYFDFTLPGEVTDYVVCVHFDDSGTIDDISMES